MKAVRDRSAGSGVRVAARVASAGVLRADDSEAGGMGGAGSVESASVESASVESAFVE